MEVMEITKAMAREEYTRICNSICELLMDGVSEDAPVIADLRDAAEALDREYVLS